MERLKCYVSGRPISADSRKGILCFAVPELGILFRCAAEGNRTSLEVVAFLSFLRFAEHNLDLFKRKTLDVYSDFPALVYLVNERSAPNEQSLQVLNQVREVARKVSFTLHWIDSDRNRAAQSIRNIPSVPDGTALKIKSFTHLDKRGKMVDPRFKFNL
jgi:hypothetical protein